MEGDGKGGSFLDDLFCDAVTTNLQREWWETWWVYWRISWLLQALLSNHLTFIKPKTQKQTGVCSSLIGFVSLATFWRKWCGVLRWWYWCQQKSAKNWCSEGSKKDLPQEKLVFFWRLSFLCADFRTLKVMTLNSSLGIVTIVICPEFFRKKIRKKTYKISASWCFGRELRKLKVHPFNTTWRIIQLSRWLVTPIYKPFKPFGRGTTPIWGTY